MTHYNSLNVTLSNSQLNKLKSGTKNYTEVTLKISSNVVGDSDDKNNFTHKLLLTNTQVSKLRKVFENVSSANIKLAKTQLHKIGQSGGFKPLPKVLLIPLGLTTAARADVAIHEKMFRSSRSLDLASHNTTLIISNEEMNDIMKIIKSFEESGLLIKNVSETIKKEEKEQKRRMSQNIIRYIRC